VADARRLQPEASVVAEFRQPQAASAAAESCPQQQEALAALELPALAESEELPVSTQESRAVDRTPQVSPYSGSLFRQPLSFSFFVLVPGR